MTVSNIDVKQTYTGDNSTTTFAIPFYFIEETMIKVYLDDVLQTVNSDYTLTGGPPVTNVEMTTAPASGAVLVVVRESPQVQDLDYDANSPWSPLPVEDRFDRVVLMIQENKQKISEATDLGPEVAANAAAIADLAVDIVTNANNIATNVGDINSLGLAIDTNVGDIVNNANDINALQGLANVVGNITLINNTEVNGPTFPGSAILHFKIIRSDAVEDRICVGTLKILNVDGTWYVSDPEYFIPAGNPPGITFGIFGSTLTITSDEMTGGAYSGIMTYTLINI